MMINKSQEEAFKKLSLLKVGALFMEMGTGKTKVALDLIASRAHKIDYALWICPCSLINEINSEKAKWQPNIELDIIGCESIGASDRIYFEILNKMEDKRCFVVVDESLKIKNISAKRTKRILKIGQGAIYKLILNGTPVTKNILDLWTQMDFLSPKILNMSYNEYKNTYCEYYTQGKLKGVVRAQHNIPHLISLINPYIFDCALDIKTSKRFFTYNYQINDRNEYEDYKMEMLNKYMTLGEDLNFNAFAMALQKWYCSFENSNKKDVLQDVLSSINDTVIVFVRYLSSIPEGATSITGNDNSEERKRKIEAFKNCDFKVLYITYGCGAYGLNLQFCKHMVFLEHTWDYAQRIQAEARIYRMGQGKSVYYYDLVCDNVGLEKLITDCVDKKSNLLDTMKVEISKVKGGVSEWVKSI